MTAPDRPGTPAVTVAALIEELRKLPPEAIVYVGKGMGPATTVTLRKTPAADYVMVTP